MGCMFDIRKMFRRSWARKSKLEILRLFHQTILADPSCEMKGL